MLLVVYASNQLTMYISLVECGKLCISLDNVNMKFSWIGGGNHIRDNNNMNSIRALILNSKKSVSKHKSYSTKQTLDDVETTME